MIISNSKFYVKLVISIVVILIILNLSYSALGGKLSPVDQSLIDPYGQKNLWSNLNDSAEKNKTDNIVLIISIDNSNSQGDINGTFDRTSKPISEFLDYISAKEKRPLNFGLVVWNKKPDEELSVFPIKNPAIIKEKVSKIKTGGNTCIAAGLRRSILMFENVSSTDKKFILFISNGNDEYCSPPENACSIADDARKLGITIFALGEINPNGNLSCIADRYRLFDTSKIPIDNALRAIADEILQNEQIADYSREQSKENGLEITKSLEEPFALTGRGDNITINDTNTNVTISKLIMGGPTGPKVVLRIMAPEARYIDKDILFAVDSSGSTKLENYEEEIRKAMNKVAEYLNNRDLGEKINISVLSWDDDIDFIYGSRNNSKNTTNDTNNAKFAPINAITIKELNEIMEKEFISDETETTIFNAGLDNGLKILSEDPNRNNPHNMRILIFITGRSEYQNWTHKKSYDNNISIFTFGIGVEDGTKMDASLYNISTLKDLGYRKTTRSFVEPTFSTFLKDILGANEARPDLGDEIVKLLNVAINKDIVRDLVIEDSTNPFLEIDKSSLEINGRKADFDEGDINKHKLILSIPGNLTPGSMTEISYNIKLNLTIPVTSNAIEGGANDLFLPDDEIKSSVKYLWQNNHKEYEINIPSNNIRIY